MATLPTYSQEYSDKVAQDNLNAALSGVRDTQPGNTSSAYTQPAGPVQAPTVASPTSAPSGGVADSVLTQPANTGTDIGSELDRIRGEALSIQELLNQRSAAEVAVGGYEAPEEKFAPEEVDEAAILRQQLKLHQAEIDATNQVYDQLLNEARLQGQGRLGSQRASAWRRGLSGSPMGEAQKAKVQGFNTDIQRGIQAERSAAIGSIMGEVRSSVREEIALKNAAKQAGAEEYNQYLADKSTRKTDYTNRIASALLTQNQDIMDYTDEELDELGREAGISAKDIKEAYYAGKAQIDAQQSADGTNDYGFMSTSGGIFRTDPATGEAVFIPSGGGSTTTGGGTSGGGGNTDFGEGDTEESQILDTYLYENRNQDPELLKQDLLNEGYSVTMVNSMLKTRPFSDRDITDLSNKYVEDFMEPSFWKSRPTELEEAKAQAIKELTSDYQTGEPVGFKGERTKQMTEQEFQQILKIINSLSGRETANELLGN